ncbi:aminofutalosine synthase MqnE [Desulfonatronum thioautotrophicum]|uniref:aminofutalosine synthase MqnE n=1 Tax=Desulfonatronum thioautotrophicum TaxID=617001 RepID=UPI001FCA2ED8|nr:aminofutalosine synthase MqnE [Desulfonatronum thioautotrophicum]
MDSALNLACVTQSKTHVPSALDDIVEKAANTERLTPDEALMLAQKADIHVLGRLALHRRTALHGQNAYFVFNQHLNYTNICQNACRFCAFSRRVGDKDGYTMTVDEAVQHVRSRKDEPVREIHIVGGLNPELPYQYYLDLVSAVKQARPLASVKAFTAVEVVFLAERGGISPRRVLADLRKAGLDALPGGGAEVFAPALRARLCPEKVSGQQWLDIHALAHELGIPSNATMLFGHIETWADRLEHLLALRELQDRTEGFLCFIPLPYQPHHNDLGAKGPDGLDTMRMLAISRIFLDNVRHLKAYWIMTGIKAAQMGLWYGADDLDGTIVEERIGHAAGANTPKGMTREQIVQVISQAGFQPVERNSHFEAVKPAQPSST